MGRAEDLFERLRTEGAAVIDEMIADRQSEELFLDFKQSADQGGGSKLHPNDRKNLAKAVSGFGNAEGGVIIWGVDCRNVDDAGDVARAKVPIKDVRRFISYLEGAVSGVTLPPHPAVEHCRLETSEGAGFVCTLIPKSYLAPHQAVGDPRYYMRAGSDFVPVPHGVLQGMFGRPPLPEMFHMWQVKTPQIVPVVGDPEGVAFQLGIMLASNGPGLARDLFMNVTLWCPDGPSHAEYGFPDSGNWDGSIIFGNRAQLVSKEHVRLAPTAMTTPVVISVTLKPPFKGLFGFELSYGHGRSPTSQIVRRIEAADLDAGFDRTVRRRDDAGTLAFLQSLFGMDKAENRASGSEG